LDLKFSSFTYLIFFVLFGIESLAQALDPPSISCLSIDGAGNVNVQWQVPADPGGEFDSYHLFSSSNLNGPYFEVAVIGNYANTSYTHPNPISIIDPVCYYMVTESFDGIAWNSINSDTLCTINLDAVPSNAPDGYAELFWTSPFPFNNAPIGILYEIWMEYPAGIWTQINAFPEGEFEWDYEVSVCDEWLNFQVQLDVGGCTFTSNIVGDQFIDAVAPAVPVVSSVSVDLATQDAIVSWLPSSSPDTQAYIVYSVVGCNSGGGTVVTPIDTVYGINNTNFIDILAATNSGPVSYLVAAFDTCYSGFPPSPNTSPAGSDCNTTIFLDPIPFGICNPDLVLEWSPYEGWFPDVYEVYHSTDGVVYTLLGTVSGTQWTYTHSNAPTGITNYYYIRAVLNSTGFSAISNAQSVLTPYPVPPAYVYNVAATVSGESEITVGVAVQATTTDHTYYLERMEEGDDDWDEVSFVVSNGSGAIGYVDTDVDPSVFSYTYRIVVQNVCGDYVDTSNIGKTILLEGIANSERLVNTLVWSKYEGWENGIARYRIYRSIGAGNAETMITELGSNINFYEDDVSALLYSPGEFCYRIEAEEIANSLGFQALSSSNILCLSQEPKIWIPSAFIVDGFNNTFGPIISFADFTNYKMIIFSRWGDFVYETNDVLAPWDGTMNGKLVQEGAYVYYVAVNDGEGRLYERRGTITMLVNGD